MDGVRLTGLWRNQDQAGKPYLAGGLGSGRLVVFPNDRKQGEKDPDFVVYLVPAEKREGRGSKPDNDFADGRRFDRGDPFGGSGRHS